jgi:hypothetical protein
MRSVWPSVGEFTTVSASTLPPTRDESLQHCWLNRMQDPDHELNGDAWIIERGPCHPQAGDQVLLLIDIQPPLAGYY